MEDAKEKSKSKLGVQETLSIGYIYLLILGVIHNTIYYNFIDVNYFEYTSILDVLISPVGVITSSSKAVIAFLSMIIISVVYLKLILPLSIKRGRKKEKNQSGKNLKKLDDLERASKNNYSILFIIGLFIFGFFIGTGLGVGIKNKKQIASNKIENNYKIEFINGDFIEAKLLGKNSLNIFYIKKGEKSVSISPVDGNVMKLQKLKK